MIIMTCCPLGKDPHCDKTYTYKSPCPAVMSMLVTLILHNFIKLLNFYVTNSVSAVAAAEHWLDFGMVINLVSLVLPKKTVGQCL